VHALDQQVGFPAILLSGIGTAEGRPFLGVIEKAQEIARCANLGQINPHFGAPFVACL
jgi:hypothetical protein